MIPFRSRVLLDRAEIFHEWLTEWRESGWSEGDFHGPSGPLFWGTSLSIVFLSGSEQKTGRDCLRLAHLGLKSH